MEIDVKIIERTGERTWSSSKGTGKSANYVCSLLRWPDEKIMFEVTDGDSQRLNNFDQYIGKPCTVVFTVRAREYQGRWFNNVQGWSAKPYVEKEPELPLKEG